jgi:hypothetical protein
VPHTNAVDPRAAKNNPCQSPPAYRGHTVEIRYSGVKDVYKTESFGWQNTEHPSVMQGLSDLTPDAVTVALRNLKPQFHQV